MLEKKIETHCDRNKIKKRTTSFPEIQNVTKYYVAPYLNDFLIILAVGVCTGTRFVRSREREKERIRKRKNERERERENVRVCACVCAFERKKRKEREREKKE